MKRRARRRPAPAKSSRVRGDIWIGDVARAWRALGSTRAEERQWIAETLGFAYRLGRAADAAPDVIPERPAPSEPTAHAASRVHADEEMPELVAPSGDASVVVPLRMVTTPRAEDERAAPPAVSVEEPLAPETERHVAFRPDTVPLLVPQWTRAIVSAAAATRLEGGSIDYARVIDAVCRMRPIVRLPRRLIWTLRAGVQLLVDRGPGMAPFTRDAALLADHFRAVAGRDRAVQLRFRDCPGRGIDDPGDQGSRSYEPPAPGTPVILISDLGLTRGAAMRRSASETEWLSFAARVRQAGCPLVVFVPCATTRWTPALRRAFHLIPWDRGTTVSLARRTAKGEAS